MEDFEIVVLGDRGRRPSRNGVHWCNARLDCPIIDRKDTVFVSTSLPDDDGEWHAYNSMFPGCGQSIADRLDRVKGLAATAVKEGDGVAVAVEERTSFLAVCPGGVGSAFGAALRLTHKIRKMYPSVSKLVFSLPKDNSFFAETEVLNALQEFTGDEHKLRQRTWASVPDVFLRAEA
nr:hypothetical protein TetV2_00306 [Oceanusvirus sp.]